MAFLTVVTKNSPIPFIRILLPALFSDFLKKGKKNLE